MSGRIADVPHVNPADEENAYVRLEKCLGEHNISLDPVRVLEGDELPRYREDPSEILEIVKGLNDDLPDVRQQESPLVWARVIRENRTADGLGVEYRGKEFPVRNAMVAMCWSIYDSSFGLPL